MSVILDALKKLEKEKAACRTGPIDIVPEIVKSRERRVQFRSWAIVTIMSGVVAVTVVMTMFFTGGLSASRQRSVPFASVPSLSTQEYLPIAPAKEAANEKDMSAVNKREESTARQDMPVQPATAVVQEVNPARSRPQTKPVIIEKPDDASQLAGAPFPSLKVSGIAWQDDRPDRRAVVNGVLAAEGAVIEGARIVAIHQDKVRFSCNGRTFEVAVAGR